MSIQINCYFSIHDIHKNSQRIYSDNFNSKERTRIIVSEAELFDTNTNEKIGKIIEKSTKIMDSDHTTLLEFFLHLDNYGKIVINDTFFLSNEQPFHQSFNFEISKLVTFRDSFGPSLFYNKNIKVKYVNVYTDFKGFFEITENI